MVALADIDFASSPYLTIIREAAGDKAVVALVKARGGRLVHLPKTPTKDCTLAQIVGFDAAKRIVDALGGYRNIDVPNGKSSRINRRIDWSSVLDLHDQGVKHNKIAETLGCTTRHIRNILRQELGRREDRLRQKSRERDRNKRKDTKLP